LKLFQLACETLPTVPRTTAVYIRKKAVISEKRPGHLVKVLGFGEVCWFGRAARHCLQGFVALTHTLQGINISHLGKRKIIFKMPFWGDMIVPWRVFQSAFSFSP